MKWHLLAASVAMASVALAASRAPSPELVRVKSVYILRMGNGLDQYLAGRLTHLGVVQVVTDPKKADAVITDRLGEGFESRMTDLYPPPPPLEEAKPKTDDKDADKTTSADKDRAEAARLSRDNSTPRIGTFGRSRGTIFLVDRNTRNVLWSFYIHPKDSSPGTMNNTAEKVARRLFRDRNPQVKVELDAGQ